MAYRVMEPCTNCGVCESECPVQAISEQDDRRFIDQELCTDCGVCSSMCPVEAIEEV